jgi:uncharacterized protein (DUF2147 family)
MKDGDPMSKLASTATLTLSALLLGVGHAPPARAEPNAQETAATTPPPDAIVGEWWTEGNEGRIRFARSPDGTYTGILVGGGGDPGTDVNNKDPALRKRPLLGSVLIWHLRPDDGEYVDGYVYNPRNGETYRMKAEVTGKATLKVRGYLGISLLGQSQTWTRAH